MCQQLLNVAAASSMNIFRLSLPVQTPTFLHKNCGCIPSYKGSLISIMFPTLSLVYHYKRTCIVFYLHRTQELTT